MNMNMNMNMNTNSIVRETYCSSIRFSRVRIISRFNGNKYLTFGCFNSFLLMRFAYEIVIGLPAGTR